MVDRLNSTLDIPPPCRLKAPGRVRLCRFVDDNLSPPAPLNDQQNLCPSAAGCRLNNQARFLKREGGKRLLFVPEPSEDFQFPADPLCVLEPERFARFRQFHLELLQHVASSQVEQAKHRVDT